jgi:hypothetical protein
MYYPIVQALARFGFSWFEISYGFDFAVTTVSDAEFAALCVIAVTTPLGGVGYFVIFLVMQPHSWKFLKSRMLTGKRFAGRATPRLLSDVKEVSGVVGITRTTMVAVAVAERQSVLFSDFDFEQSSVIPPLRESLQASTTSHRINFDTLDDEDLLYCIVSAPTSAAAAAGVRVSDRVSEEVSLPSHQI